MSQRLTVIKIKGDTDEILRTKAQHIDPVMNRKGPEHGGLWSVTARTTDGVLIVNLWPDEESSERAFQDPEVQGALQAAGATMAGPPERDHYEVADYQTA
jgi:quinol monooxygenase YgiN